MGYPSLKNLDDWMTDPVQLRRLDELVVYTQRIAFIKSIMNLKSSDRLIFSVVERSCERRGLPCKSVRGRPVHIFNYKHLSIARRYAASVLLKALYNTDDADLEAGADGTLVVGELLDRMLYVYGRYLHQSKLSPAEAPLSFEYFAFMRQQYALAELEFVGCDVCGSEYLTGLRLDVLKCPICVSHKHAIRPSDHELLTRDLVRRSA